MNFDGFTDECFILFGIPTFEERMQAVREILGPRLMGLGTLLAPDLSRLGGEPLVPHVAKHLRRRVNPPDDTWVAWGPSARGYKAFPHFEAGIAADGLFARFVLKPEAQSAKPAVLASLSTGRLTALKQSQTRPVYWYRGDHGEGPVPVDQLSEDTLASYIVEAQKPQHSVAIGEVMTRRRTLGAGPDVARWFLAAFQDLAPLYRQARTTAADGVEAGVSPSR